MSRVDWVGENSLTRMEGFRSFARLLPFPGPCAGNRGRLLRDVQQRQIVNRTGPGEFRIVECGVSLGSGQCWPGNDEEHDMPKRRRENRPSWNASRYAAVAKQVEVHIALGQASPLKKRQKFTEEALMKALPGHRQAGLARTSQLHSNRERFLLPE